VVVLPDRGGKKLVATTEAGGKLAATRRGPGGAVRSAPMGYDRRKAKTPASGSA